MNEEIECAEMLEIPVSTVNVVKKKNRRVRGKNAPNLKERLISRVNNRVGDPDYSRAAPRMRSRRIPSMPRRKTPPSKTRRKIPRCPSPK